MATATAWAMAGSGATAWAVVRARAMVGSTKERSMPRSMVDNMHGGWAVVHDVWGMVNNAGAMVNHNWRWSVMYNVRGSWVVYMSHHGRFVVIYFDGLVSSCKASCQQIEPFSDINLALAPKTINLLVGVNFKLVIAVFLHLLDVGQFNHAVGIVVF